MEERRKTLADDPTDTARTEAWEELYAARTSIARNQILLVAVALSNRNLGSDRGGFLDWPLRGSQRDQHNTDDCEDNHPREFPALDYIPVFLRSH